MSIVPAVTPGVMVLRTRSEGESYLTWPNTATWMSETCMFIEHRMHKFDRVPFKTSFETFDLDFVKQAQVQKSCLTIPAAEAIADFLQLHLRLPPGGALGRLDLC